MDTIHSIALKFKMSTGELLRLNGLPSTYRIYAGQVREKGEKEVLKGIFYVMEVVLKGFGSIEAM